MSTRNPLTLSRQELYELVWSKPVTEVAKEIGLSDVAVAKRCRQVQVPLPPRGYWARVTSGQTPSRPALPKYRDSSSSIRARQRASLLGSSPTLTLRAATSSEEVDREHGPEPTVTFHVASVRSGPAAPEESPVPPDPQRTALDAKLAALSVASDAPKDWLHVGDAETLPPGWPERLRTPARLPIIAAHSKSSEFRARRLATHLIDVITALGWRFIARQPDPPGRWGDRGSYGTTDNAEQRSAHFLVENERLFISITERRTRTERPLTPEEQRERRNAAYFYYRDRYQYHPSGELTLHVSTTSGTGGFASFRDTKRAPLETRISDVVRCLLRGALDIKTRRREAAEAGDRERQESVRLERLRRTREAHASVIRRLEAEAGAWERAKRLRRYLRAARRALRPGERIEADLEGDAVDILALGERFADQLDPLHPSVRSTSLFDGKDPYATGLTYQADGEKLQSFIVRVIGGDWRHAPKRSLENDRPPTASTMVIPERQKDAT